ncbi:MAG: prepilin-type N-terminal cleavage/methylation domain-containing protein [Myxococcota bacterium]
MSSAHRKTVARMRARGFTLLEAIIAISVFSIGLMAAVSMEFIALNAYTAARDTTQATEIARRVVAITHVEALNWESTPGLTPPADTMRSVYAGAGSPFVATPILALVTTNAQIWQVLTPDPVDENLSTDNTRRFCVFVRGDFFQNVATAVGTNSPLIQTQVAVVYPGSGRQVSSTVNNCRDLVTAGCGGATIEDSLNPVFDITMEDASALERCGLRVVRSASVVQKAVEQNI